MSSEETKTYSITEHTVSIGMPIEPGSAARIVNLTGRAIRLRCEPRPAAGASAPATPDDAPPDQFAQRCPRTSRFLRSVTHLADARNQGLYHADATDFVGHARKFATVADAVCWACELADRARHEARAGALLVVRVDGRTGKVSGAVGTVKELLAGPKAG